MNIRPDLIFFCLHILLAFIYIFLILSGRSNLRNEYIVLILLLPVFGLLLAITVEYIIKSGKEGKKSLDIEEDVFSDDILWKTLKRFHEKGDIVPLEEAILINDLKTRRKFMLETLYGDPLKYLDILMVAKDNEDVETSHYATTSISYIQRSFQLSIQKFAVELENDPNNIELLDDYIGTLRNYIESGLLEEHLLKNLRVSYSKILDRKLALIKDDSVALIEKIKNDIELGDYVSAYKTSDLLKVYWPDDEQTWLAAIRVCVDGNDNNRLVETLAELKSQKINWTRSGMEQISPWLKSENA